MEEKNKINLAIIVTISKYKSEYFNDLNSTENDFKYMSELLNKTKKYDKILEIKTSRKSDAIIKEIRKLIDSYKNQEINEVLFYFSGHGYNNGEKFYYCVTYSEVSKLRETAISLDEIDDLIRELNPFNYVRIIDACNSGSKIIKGIPKTIENENRTSEFNNCFFFSSSRSNEESLVDPDSNMGYYTKGFVNSIYAAIITDKINPLTFADLVKKLGIYFEKNVKQKPLIEEQHTGSEIFINSTPELIEYLKSIKDIIKSTATEPKELLSIPSEIEALDFKDKLTTLLIEGLSNKRKQGKEIKNRKYSVETEAILPDKIFQKAKIGAWIEEHQGKCFLFAKPVYDERYIGSPLTKIFDGYLNYNKNNYETYLSSFESFVDAENTCKNILMKSTESSVLPEFLIQVVFLFNANKIYILYNLSYRVPKNWKEHGKFITKSDVIVTPIKIFDPNSKIITDKIVNDINIYFNEILATYITELELV